MIPLGVSLPVDYLCGACGIEEARLFLAAFGPAAEGLSRFKQAGVSSVELHHFTRLTAAEDVERATAAVLRAGLRLTVHGYLMESLPEDGLDGCYPWLPAILDMTRGGQDRLVITVHALAAKSGSVERLREGTVEQLSLLARLAADRDPRVRFALELTREKGVADPCTTWEGVESTCRRVGREDVGICWDWGHGVLNALHGYIPRDPPEGFLSRVENTHVHDISPDGKAHWPLLGGGVPADRFVSLLRGNGYRGLFGLELNPVRFQGHGPVGPLVEGSLEALRKLLEP